MRGRQGRFLGVTIGLWITLRVWLLWPAMPLAVGALPAMAAPAGGSGAPHFTPARSFQPLRVFASAGAPRGLQRRDAAGAIVTTSAEAHDAGRGDTGPQLLGGFGATARRPPAEGMRAPATPLMPVERPSPVATAGRGRTIEGQAYLFVRPGSKRAALAPAGSLGGSQAAARVAIALNRSGPVRTAIAARVYAPLNAKGAEAAFGLDWHPLAGAPLRLSIERRIGLDRAGRDAWSAYAAGGFHAGRLPLGLEADGYAQAGVVGARRRDLFADAALRAGRRIELAPVAAILGIGSWGAAQPGAARLDVGPRLALSLPVERHTLTLAIEGRLRVAGRASPGSGAALTLAADF